MPVTLQTQYGEFTAETPEQATRDARKAEKLARKADELRRVNREHAELLALQTAYWMYRCHNGEDGGLASSYTIASTSDKEFPHVVDASDDTRIWRRYRIWTQYGDGLLELYQSGSIELTETLIAVAVTHAGTIRAVFVRENGKVTCWAVAAHNDVLARVPMYGIELSDFHE